MMTLQSRHVKLLISMLSGAILLGGGCGSDAQKTVPVQGKVTLAGGAWPKSGMVTFTPTSSAEGFPKKPGIGQFETDGSFVVESDQKKGLYPGEYRIAVICWETPPTHEARGKAYTPKNFTQPALSGLTLKIEPGQSGPVVWEHDFPRAK
jgi:hypothetical protein